MSDLLYPRVRVKHTGCGTWQARVIHYPNDLGVYLIGDFGPISYKWIAKRFLGKYPTAKAPDLRKMLDA